MIAATVAAGFTGAALRDLLEKVEATPHTEAFARALENGSLLLWVAGEGARLDEAEAILKFNGARDVHRHLRTARQT